MVGERRPTKYVFDVRLYWLSSGGPGYPYGRMGPEVSRKLGSTVSRNGYEESAVKKMNIESQFVTELG